MSSNETEAKDAAPGGAADANFPWKDDPDAATACNLATANLSNALPRMVAGEKGVQAETYLCAAGLIAGYAAQRTLIASDEVEGLQVITTDAGRRFLYGQPINRMLLAETAAEAQGRVVNIALGTAAHHGADIGIEDVGPMAQYVSKAISEGGPFMPSPPAPNRPLADCDALIAQVWPQVREILQADFDERHRMFGPVPDRWYCAVCARPVARVIAEVRNVLDPRIAATLVIESAIYASKLMPAEPRPES